MLVFRMNENNKKIALCRSQRWVCVPLPQSVRNRFSFALSFVFVFARSSPSSFSCVYCLPLRCTTIMFQWPAKAINHQFYCFSSALFWVCRDAVFESIVVSKCCTNVTNFNANMRSPNFNYKICLLASIKSLLEWEFV